MADPQGQNDSELAKMLLERQERCRHLELDLGDTKQTLKIAQMHIREWQAKFEALQKSLVFPKLRGLQLAIHGPPMKRLTKVLSPLDAIKELLVQHNKEACVLLPVFDGDIENPKPPSAADDSSDDGCEPVG